LFNNSGSTGGSANLTFNLNQNLFAVGTNTVFANVTSGLVGIGTSSPATRMHINKPSQTPGDTTPSGALLVTNLTAGDGCIEIGSGSSILGYLQVRNRQSQTYYDFALQPNGGNVGIGTSSPDVKLRIDAASPTRGIVETVRGTGSTGSQICVAQDGIADWAFGQPAGVNALAFFSGRSPASDGTERMRLDSSGNLGLGVTPSAWETANSVRALQLNGGNVSSFSNAYIWVGQNWYRDSASAERYVNTAAATKYQQAFGAHQWYNAASGTAGNTISFTQAMTLTAAGVLCVGVTSNTSRGGGNATLLTYKASGTNYIDIQCGSSGDSGLLFSTASSGNYGLINYRNSAGDLLFYTTSVERMRLTATGLGISEANNPTQALSLYRSGSTNAIMSAGNSNTGLDGTWFGVDTAGNGIVNVRGAFPLLFSTNAIERMRIDTNGDVALGSSSVARVGSDRTLYIEGTAFASLNLGCGGAYAGAGLTVNSEAALLFRNTGAERARITSAGHFRPGADNTYNLGEAAYRWANIYTADLNLSNRDSQNDVDGTWGEWTIQEGENDLYLINRRNGKKFKFMLKEVE
jgi:hypothetical protein